jgi:hypothetical protein
LGADRPLKINRVGISSIAEGMQMDELWFAGAITIIVGIVVALHGCGLL